MDSIGIVENRTNFNNGIPSRECDFVDRFKY